MKLEINKNWTETRKPNMETTGLKAKSKIQVETTPHPHPPQL